MQYSCLSVAGQSLLDLGTERCGEGKKCDTTKLRACELGHNYYIKKMSERNYGCIKNVASVVILPHGNFFQTLEQHCCQGGLQLCIC